ncbi:MAG: hypothetical protein ACT4PW_14740, partial [Acidimicrobiia bacterium]
MRSSSTATTTGTVDWRLAAEALAEEVKRVTALLRTVRNPTAPATGQWNLAEVAVHLAQAWVVVPGLAADDLSEVYAALPQLEARADGSLIGDVWDLGRVTTDGVKGETERDLKVLADHIDQRAGAFLAGLHDGRDQERHTWLVEGMTVALPTLIGHLLNETIVHGWDIARADGRRWTVSRAHAALVIDGFLIPVITSLGPRTMVDQNAAAGLRATFEVRVRGGGRHLFAFDDGALEVKKP